VDDLRRYHELAIAPYWSRIQEHLEGDTHMRGQALALGGVEALASTLALVAAYRAGVSFLLGAPALDFGREMDDPAQRTIDALENLAAELERLRLLKERELGARVEYSGGDPYFKPADEPQSSED
jgi:hypothetical protein